MAVTFRQAELFRLVMQTRNLTETARLLRISQPAVSQALKELEGQIGLVLFERTGNRISPTGEARALLPDMERLIAQVRVIEDKAAELRDQGAGSLSVASTSNVAGVVLPGVVAAFMAERPRVRMQLNAYVTRDEVVRQVRQEGADLGLLYAPVDDRGFAVEPVMRARMACVLPPGSALAGLAEITPAQLRDVPVVIAAPSGTPGLLFRARLDEMGVSLDRVIETNFSYAAIGLTRAGLGVFVTDPLILMTELADGLVVRPLAPALPLTLAAIYTRQRSVPRLAVRFIVHLRATLVRLASERARPECEVIVI